MNELPQKILKYCITLFIFCLAAAAILSGVNMMTSKRIIANRIAEAKRKRQKVLPRADKESFQEKEIDGKQYFLGFDKNGEFAGLVFEVKGLGFGGPISVTVGVDKEDKISGIAISKLDQSETPGLGIKITTPKFQGQFNGKTEKEMKLKKDGGAIDAITAATISSNAVVKAVRRGLQLYKRQKSEISK